MIPDRLNLSKWLNRLLKPPKVQSGFTLIEVLIAAAIGSIIISSLLWLLVNLVGTERRESALTDTERDMKRALDYIVADLKQAVYIYDGGCSLVVTTNVCSPYFHSDPDTAANRFLPTWVEEMDNANPDTVPVLAFWKTDPADTTELDGITCATPTYTGAALDECNNLKRRRYTYSLVVYTQDVPQAGQDWAGQTVIYRQEIPKYRDADSDGNYYDDFANNRMPGFVDPTDTGVGIFTTWPYILSGTTQCNLQTNTTTTCAAVDGSLGDSFFPASVRTPVNGTYAQRQVLTDFVDELLPSDLTDADTTCPSADYRLTTLSNNNTAVSTDDTAILSRTFYACVRSSTASVGQNQDVILFLRGNAKGRSGTETDLRTAVLQTRVTLRGIIDKEP
ncbi:MAG: prepilin-type N-terminal cleavage/methylation domain-containing protein [Prochlorotrichaceae cyanobacterium]|jgi:prepilin-type N-terminal cleavage/methylation domain-containing protein